MKVISYLTLLLVIAFVACKKSDDSSNSNYNMECPSKPNPTTFQLYGPGAALPSAFTPNGDGLNDRLRLIGLDSAAFKSITLKVIEATGKTLYTTTHPFTGWDGINSATGKAYPTAQYRIEYSGM